MPAGGTAFPAPPVPPGGRALPMASGLPFPANHLNAMVSPAGMLSDHSGRAAVVRIAGLNKITVFRFSGLLQALRHRGCQWPSVGGGQRVPRHALAASTAHGAQRCAGTGRPMGTVTELSMAKALHRQHAAAACRRHVDARTRRVLGKALAGQWSGTRRSSSMPAIRPEGKTTPFGNDGFQAIPSAATSSSGIC